jgi:purine-binding chemotaxis protein CheW
MAAPDRTTRRADADRYLTFALGGETYALPIADVTEIMEHRTLTVVPMMPAHIRGVINLRGKVVPVVDLATRFGGGSTMIGRRTSIIILETTAHHAESPEATHRTLGIIVDAVSTVMELSAAEMEAPPSFGRGIRTDFISGMAKHDGSFIVVLDVKRLLSTESHAGMIGTGDVDHSGAETEGRAVGG